MIKAYYLLGMYVAYNYNFLNYFTVIFLVNKKVLNCFVFIVNLNVIPSQ
jgi:hypothetical protein